jgi:hypothetical protein
MGALRQQAARALKLAIRKQQGAFDSANKILMDQVAELQQRIVKLENANKIVDITPPGRKRDPNAA